MAKTGRRVGYGIAMFLSGLILLLSVAGIAGVWIAQRALANSAVQILGAMDDFTGSLRQATQTVDQKLESMQAVSTQISTASAQLSQNVTDKGLILLLLPEQQEQQLVALSSSVKDAFSTLHGTLAAGVELYRSIDRLPFVSLPAPSQEQVTKIGEAAGEIQSAVDGLVTDVAAFRSGATDQIGKVGTGADLLTSRLGQFRDQLASLDARLALAQQALVQLQQTAVRTLVLASVLVTLLLVWVIYSQIEVLRLYGGRWKASGTKTTP